MSVRWLVFGMSAAHRGTVPLLLGTLVCCGPSSSTNEGPPPDWFEGQWHARNCKFDGGDGTCVVDYLDALTASERGAVELLRTAPEGCESAIQTTGLEWRELDDKSAEVEFVEGGNSPFSVAAFDGVQRLEFEWVLPCRANSLDQDGNVVAWARGIPEFRPDPMGSACDLKLDPPPACEQEDSQ